jgi:broad specificity phosphatase PhoE
MQSALKGVYLLRHGKSMSNMGYPLISNSPLSPLGIKQARQLEYKADLIITSPMRRALDTLAHSNIRYNQLLIVQQARELICEPGDCYSSEICQLEDPIIFNRKMRSFANQIYLLSRKYESVLIITHGCVITALTNKQVNNCQLTEISDIRLKQVINGISLPNNYHQMTGW